MLTRNKLYKRNEPSKDATLLLIFCEGSRTEPDYFEYFSSINSQINIITIPADSQSDNSPTGLFEVAGKMLNPDDEAIAPKYQINDDDQVWFVIDTDQWGKKLDELRSACEKYSNWFIAQSNPCFEVWLYCHYFDFVPTDFDPTDSTQWKENLNLCIKGGFDCRKHPILIETAIINAKTLHELSNNVTPPFTEVYKLGDVFYSKVKDEILSAKERSDLLLKLLKQSKEIT